jgi:hypothetical protein
MNTVQRNDGLQDGAQKPGQRWLSHDYYVPSLILTIDWEILTETG